MTDADLLDLLEILEVLVHTLYMEAEEGSSSESSYQKAERMIQSFRTAIRQRMTERSGEV